MGEEFAVLLPDTPQAAACDIAERLRAAIAQVNVSAEHRVTASIGVACASANDTELDTLLSGADKAMYRAKATGRDRVAVVEPVRAAV